MTSGLLCSDTVPLRKVTITRSVSTNYNYVSVKTTTDAVAVNPLRETVEMKENTSYGPVKVQSQTATQEPVYDVADTIQPRESVRTAGNVAYRHVGP